MKNRIFMTFLFALALVTLTVGCEKKEENNNNNNNTQPVAQEKKLICSNSEKEDDYTEEIKYTYNFKDEKINTVTMLSTTRYNSGKYDEKTSNKYAEDCNEALELTKKAGFTCNVQSSGSSIWVTYQFTLADLNEDSAKIAKENGVDEVKDKSYDELKSLFETGGFKCQ